VTVAVVTVVSAKNSLVPVFRANPQIIRFLSTVAPVLWLTLIVSIPSVPLDLPLTAWTLPIPKIG